MDSSENNEHDVSTNQLVCKIGANLGSQNRLFATVSVLSVFEYKVKVTLKMRVEKSA